MNQSEPDKSNMPIGEEEGPVICNIYDASHGIKDERDIDGSSWSPLSHDDSEESAEMLKDSGINDESLSSSGLITSSTGSFSLVKSAFLDEARRLSNHLCERRLVKTVSDITEDTDFRDPDANTDATENSVCDGVAQDQSLNPPTTDEVSREIAPKSFSWSHGDTPSEENFSDNKQDVEVHANNPTLSDNGEVERDSTFCIQVQGLCSDNHPQETPVDAAEFAVKRQSLTLEEALALKDMLEDSGDHGSFTSCSTMSSAMSSTGSFGFIKAAFFDEISHCSNHRCVKREDKKDQIDMDAQTDELNSEMNESFVHEDYNAVGSTRYDFLKESITDETRRLNDRVRAIRKSNDIPIDIIINDDLASHTTTESENDGDTLSNEECLAARNKANDEFEKAQQVQREKEEAEARQEKSSSSQTKKISFSTVEVREYERIIGDHPSCSSGPPISIGWEHDPKSTRRMSVDEHDLQRWNKRSPMRLSKQQRASLLLELGFRGKDIVRSVRKIEKDKKRRNQTVHNLHMGKVEEIAESARRKIKKSLRRKTEPCEKWTPVVEKIKRRSSLNGVSGLTVRVV